MAQDNLRHSDAAENRDCGIVRIADDVVAMIASYAALEVDGVASMAGNTTYNLLSRSGGRVPVKGVRVEVTEGNVKVDLAVAMNYGFNIPATSSNIQKRVSSAIENMTGLGVSDVNVRIAGIVMPKSDDIRA